MIINISEHMIDIWLHDLEKGRVSGVLNDLQQIKNDNLIAKIERRIRPPSHIYSPAIQ